MTTTPTLWRAEQQAHTTSSGPGGDDQFDQQIVGLANGTFVVLWTDNSDAGVGNPDGTDIIGQRYDADGTAIGGGPFLINFSFFGDDEGKFTAAALPDGGFVVVYEDTDTNGTSIRFSKWSAAGIHVETNTIVDDPGADTLNSPSVSVNADGGFIVGYQQINAAGTSIDVRFVSVSSTLVVRHPEIDIAGGGVPTATFGPQVDSALLTNGRTVILSRTDPLDQAGAQDQLLFRLVTATALVGAEPTVVATTATNSFTDNAPAVAALTGGGFVVAWEETDANDTDGRFQRFDAAGNAVGALGSVNNTGGDDFKQAPDVIGLSDGGFVIVYSDRADSTIKLQRYAANGDEVGAEVTVTGSSLEITPTVTLSDDGRLIVGWTGRLISGSPPARRR